ncbi:transposase [Rhizobium oryziradicis]|uniref:transposase n=1 Tax=Rhizobium oryziradicis TaxID=1867956 RepID=UPI000B1D7EAC|nr:transposase [Rhizobium oryziradicis]
MTSGNFLSPAIGQSSTACILSALTGTSSGALARPFCADRQESDIRRRFWSPKLHLGLDLASGEITCSELTTDNVGEPTALPDLLDQIDGSVARFIADGAYDGSPTRGLLETRLGELVEVIIRLPRRQFKVRNQTTEAKIGVRVLNRMTELGCPEFKRVA